MPATLTLTFSAKLIGGEGSTEVVVTDPDGNQVTDGPAARRRRDRHPAAEGIGTGRRTTT